MMEKVKTVIAVCLLVLAANNLRFAVTYSPVVNIQLLMDEASLLGATESAFVVDYHNTLLDDYDIDYRVMTTAARKVGIDQLAAERFATLEGGNFAESGRGLLLVVNPRTDQARLEVGGDLGGIYTNDFVAQLVGTQMEPFFRDNQVDDGIVAATEAIVTRAQEATKNLALDVSPAAEPPAVAALAPPISTRSVPRDSLAPMPDVTSEGSPLETVDAYIQAMEKGNARADLDIYSTSSQEMLKNWVLTQAQMRNVAREHRRCTGEHFQVQGDKAVVRYDPEPGVCNPYFLCLEEGKWRIDFASMQKYIRFDESNHWQLPWGVGKFSFAFPDLPEQPASASEPGPREACRWCFTFRSDDLVILSVEARSVGERMGLMVGDKILALDGEVQPSIREALTHLHGIESGRLVTIKVARDGRELTLIHLAP